MKGSAMSQNIKARQHNYLSFCLQNFIVADSAGGVQVTFLNELLRNRFYQVKRKTKPCPKLAKAIVGSQVMGTLSDDRGEKIYVKWCCKDIPEFVCMTIQLTNFALTNMILLVDEGVVINAIHHPSYCPTRCHLPLTNTPTLCVFYH